MHKFTPIVKILMFPSVIIAVALLLKNQLLVLAPTTLQLINFLPYVLAGIAIVLSVQFNQMRTILVNLTLTLSYLIIQEYLQSSLSEPATFEIFALVSFFLPLILMSLSWLPEKGILNSHGLFYIVILSSTVAMITYLNLSSDVFLNLTKELTIRTLDYSILSPTTLFLYFLALMHQFIRLHFFNQSFDAAVAIIFIGLSINFINFDQPNISVVLFSALQLVIIWSLLKKSHDMAYRDELTGLPGRRALNEALNATGRNYVLAMMDIDHFKKFNDQYGHDVGDDVLKVVASKIATVTGGGKAYRFGGEEFTVLFKGKELHACIPHLEAVRELIAHYKLTIRNKGSRPKSLKAGKQIRTTTPSRRKTKRGVSVTISIGVAQNSEKLDTTSKVLKAADNALYKAKKAGRNCLITV